MMDNINPFYDSHFMVADDRDARRTRRRLVELPCDVLVSLRNEIDNILCKTWGIKSNRVISGSYKKAAKVYLDRVYIRPVEHHYENAGEPEYIKYGCPICESFGARHSFARGTKNCPICKVNLLWDDSDVLMQYEEEIDED